MSKPEEDRASATNDAADAAEKYTLALNPLVGLRDQDLVGSAQTIFKAVIKQPEIAVSQWLTFLGDLGKIAAGQSERALPAGEKRFNDAAWKTSKPHQALLQSYFAWADAVSGYVEKVNLDAHERARAKLITDMLIDALSPTNGLLTNPAALKKLVDTGGESLLSGLKNYISDLVRNGGMPSQVDIGAFAVGRNSGDNAGAVVLRDPMFELIQYKPMTPEVWRRRSSSLRRRSTNIIRSI